MTSPAVRGCPLWLALVLGLAAWMYRAASHWASPSEPAWGATLLLLSPLVIVPIVCARLERMEFPRRSRALLALASWWQVPTALLAVPALSLPISAASLGLAIPWLTTTLLIGLAGLLRWCEQRRWDGPNRTVDAGLMFLPVGGAWLCLWRGGFRPLGFEEVIVMLTAIHFHSAGLVLPLLAGWSAEQVGGRLGRWICGGVVLGVPGVAVGITATQAGASPVIEAAAAVGLSLAGVGVAWLQLGVGADFGRWGFQADFQ